MPSRTGTARLHDVMAGYVTRGVMPGVVMLVDHAGDAWVDAIEARADTIFRISSMTKPITAAAAMLLVEDGQIRLDEPVDRLLPELAGRRVLRRLDGPLDDTVPAVRPISIQ